MGEDWVECPACLLAPQLRAPNPPAAYAQRLRQEPGHSHRPCGSEESLHSAPSSHTDYPCCPPPHPGCAPCPLHLALGVPLASFYLALGCTPAAHPALQSWTGRWALGHPWLMGPPGWPLCGAQGAAGAGVGSRCPWLPSCGPESPIGGL